MNLGHQFPWAENPGIVAARGAAVAEVAASALALLWKLRTEREVQ